MAAVRTEEKAKRWERRFEKPMLAVAMLVLPVVMLDTPSVHGRAHTIGVILNWVTWSAFAFEFIVMMAVVPSRGRYLRKHPVEVIVVFFTFPMLTLWFDSLRLLRLLRVLRLAPAVRWMFTAEGVKYVVLFAVISVFGSAAVFADVERISFWNGVYWSVSTITTVGYGDIRPHTEEGKSVAMMLMVLGIVLAAIVTGAVAERFLVPHSERIEADERVVIGKEEEIIARLDELSARVAELAGMLPAAAPAEATGSAGNRAPPDIKA